MQYTLRNIPAHLDELIRLKARQQNKSLNEVAIQALMQAFGLQEESTKHRDLSDIAGTWQEDDQIEKVLQEQRMLDPELWR